MLINWNTNVERYQFSFKMICIQQNFYYKPSIYGNLFVEINKLILYFTSKCKGSKKKQENPRGVKQVEGITSLAIKTCYEVSVIKRVCYSPKDSL